MFVRVILVVCFISTVVLGQTSFAEKDIAPMELKEIASRPAEFQGRRVEVHGQVVSVSADYQTLDIFDFGSKTLMTISLNQLSRLHRRALVNRPVHQVIVTGRIEMRKGRPVLRAEKVAPVGPETLART